MSDIYEKRYRVQDLCDNTSHCNTCPARNCCEIIDTATEAQLDAMLRAFEQGPASEQPKEAGAPKILDSGERTQYSTGAVRDCKEGKGRCDLMPLDVVARFLGNTSKTDHVLELIGFFKESADVSCLYNAIGLFGTEGDDPFNVANRATQMLEASKHFEEGAKKYGENNWQKGIPVHSYIDSAIRHYLKYRAGWADEPHARAFVWNLMCCIWTMEHHPELDDFTEKRAEK